MATRTPGGPTSPATSAWDPTALYHYFESKQHCLFEIMDGTVADFRARFDRVAGSESDVVRALERLVRECFDLTPHDVQRNRLIVAEHGLLSRPRSAPGEERARQTVRARMRDLEFAWATLLSRAMQQGVIPEQDSLLLARAVLGFYNSVWQWYRPHGIIALSTVADFYAELAHALVGLPPEAIAPERAAA